MKPDVRHGDMREVLRELAAEGRVFHACVTDPPYHLTSIHERFAKTGGADRQVPKKEHQYARLSRGFMGQEWDGGDIAFRPETWRAVWDVLAPGAHLVAFSGTRTFHRMAVAIEDAGFEIRDTLMWLYGQGFPKSHNQEGEWDGWGTALKPAWEPIVLARKPLGGTVAANVLQHGTGALNIDGCRVPGAKPDTTRGASPGRCMAGKMGAQGRIEDDGLGRWPANVLHDGSPEVEDAFAAFGERRSSPVLGQVGWRPGGFGNVGAPAGGSVPCASGYGDAGSASRFFYAAKATGQERVYCCRDCGARWMGSVRACEHDSPLRSHPTVKPVELMRWLVRLITPPGGSVLDPFAGSGTTLAAAALERAHALGVELDPEHVGDIRHRLAQLGAGDAPPVVRPRPAKAATDLPLFAALAGL